MLASDKQAGHDKLHILLKVLFYEKKVRVDVNNGPIFQAIWEAANTLSYQQKREFHTLATEKITIIFLIVKALKR